MVIMNQSESESSKITTTTTTISAATINAQDNENANASSGGESQLMETRDSKQLPTGTSKIKNKSSVEEENFQQTNVIPLDNINDIENNNITKQIQTLLDSTERTLREQAATASSTTTVIATTTATKISDNIKNTNNINNSYNYNSLANQAAQVVANASQLKILAPAMTRDMTIPNTGKKVPMVMVPVPDTGHLIAIPLATINQLKDSDQTLMGGVSKDEEQARDLLNWENGVGTLEGCDLRFKINELGNLELIDSDDESENQKNHKRPYQANVNHHHHQQQAVNNKKQANNNAISASNQKSFSDDTKFHPKKAKLDQESTPSVKQISPGSSLLRDGPDIRRPKSSSSSTTTPNSLARNNQLTSNNNNNKKQEKDTISLLKKVETQDLKLLLDEKIVPKQKLVEMRSNVDQWTIEDVSSFIDSIPGCGGYGELFKLQQICGKSLLYLDQRDLLDIIDVKFGPAVKIYHAISLLKS